MEVIAQAHVPVALPPRKYSPAPIGYEAGWPRSRSGQGGEEKISLPLPEIEPRSSISLPRRCTDPSYLDS